MKKICVLTVVACVLASARTAIAVPVVPNFTQGAMTSTTETTSTVTETINSMNYDTGYQYVITGTNVQMDGTSISPTGAFQFTESYSGPGLKTQTIIQRTTQIQSVTNTTSTFSN